MIINDSRGNKIGITKCDDKVVGIYCKFGNTYTKESYLSTRIFGEREGGEIHVDISGDWMPIGIQWINASGIKSIKTDSVTRIVDENFKYDAVILQLLASQLALIGGTEKYQTNSPLVTYKKDDLVKRVVEAFSFIMKAYGL